MKRKLFTLFLLLACAPTVFAQEYRKSFLETLFDTDTTYIEPQHYDWTVMGQGSYVFDRVSMDFGDGGQQTTNIDNIMVADQRESNVEGIFNLSGQRLSAPQNGINIINGKKVVVK